MKIFALALLTTALASCGVSTVQTDSSDTKSIAPWEDCLSLNYNNLTVVPASGGFTIVDGSHALFHFSNHADAVRGMDVLKTYHVTHSCFVGRPGPSMQYVLSGPSADAPSGNLLAGEDCLDFNRSNLQIQFVGGAYKIVDGSHWLLDFGSSHAEAQTALNAINFHKFDEVCYVKRPHPPLVYWKTKPVVLPSVNVVKQNCSTHVGNAGTLFQCPTNRVISAILDNQDVFGAFETVQCCSLRAGGNPVTYASPNQFQPLFAGGAANCGPNKFLTGVNFNTQGRVSSVACRTLQSVGKAVVDFGPASAFTLNAHGSAHCGGNSLGKALGDTVTADGDVDTLRCRMARRVP